MPDLLNYALTDTLGKTTINQAGGISAAATTMTVTAGSGPATPFNALIDREAVKVTNIAGSVWTITRAQEQTTAASHANGAVVWQLRTAGVFVITVAAKIVDSQTQQATIQDYSGGFDFALLVPGLNAADHHQLADMIAYWLLQRKAGLL
jgi:hypothetical protein